MLQKRGMKKHFFLIFNFSIFAIFHFYVISRNTQKISVTFFPEILTTLFVVKRILCKRWFSFHVYEL